MHQSGLQIGDLDRLTFATPKSEKKINDFMGRRETFFVIQINTINI